MRKQPRRFRRSQRQGKGNSNDRWLITYADLITLLLIFFVVLYAMSRLDVDKYDIVTQSLQLTFHSGDSLVEKGSGVLGSKDKFNLENPPTNQGSEGKGAEGEDQQPLTERELAFRKQEEELGRLMNRIQSYIQSNKLDDQVQVADLPKGITITLNDQFLFDPGRAELKEGANATLAQLANLFLELQTTISIEGHTDSAPIINPSKFLDNWELSGARALSVLRYFVDKQNLNPQGFQYAGYSDTRPAADNSTATGRAKNRRVEIIVLRQLQQ